MEPIDQLPTCISWLYTPGNRPERFRNTKIPAGIGRILDLEDAIAQDMKTFARENIVTFLSQNGVNQTYVNDFPLAVRINHTETATGLQDLTALIPFGAQIFIILPKTEDRTAIDRIYELIPQAKVIIMIESARGILDLGQFISHPIVVGVMFGAGDFASDLDVSGKWDSLLYARQVIIMHARAQKYPVWDSPYFDIHNDAGLTDEAYLARDLGFSGKVAIHPKQIEIIEKVFAPTDTEISWAQEVVDIIENDAAIAVIEGKFIDKAMLAKAQRVLAKEKLLNKEKYREIDSMTPEQIVETIDPLEISQFKQVGPGRYRETSGLYFEDFVIGHVFEHRPGRTITDIDNIYGSLLTMNTQPVHFDAHYASYTEWKKLLVDSTITLAILTGMSVRTISAKVVANLGWDKVRIPHPVFAGDTLYAESEVLSKRDSSSRPAQGIVTVKTTGTNQDKKIVMEFERTVLVYKRAGSPHDQAGY